MNIDELKSTPEWKAAPLHKRQEFLAKAKAQEKIARRLEAVVTKKVDGNPDIDVSQKVKTEAKKKHRKKKSSAKKKQHYSVGSVDVKTDLFLTTYEWRKIRMEALKKYGPVCQCCGATPSTGAVMNVDHIKPRKLFPHLALDLSNLQVLCHECNHGKGNWDMTDWRAS